MLRSIAKVLILSLILFSEVSFAQSSQLVYVTGVLDNQTKTLPYSGFKNILSFYSDAITSNIHLKSYTESPTTGNFFLGLILNTSAKIRISYFNFTNLTQTDLCEIQVSAISLYHATMIQISQNTSAPYLCTFSGNPDTNTAKITITDRL